MYIYIIIGFISLFLELGFLPGLFPGLNIPELILPLIVVLALLKGEKEAISIALLFGFLKDMYFYRAFGLRTLLFFLLALILGESKDKFVRKSIFVTALMTLISALVFNVMYSFGLLLLSEPVKSDALISSIFSLEIPIQVLASLIYFKILSRPKKKRVRF